MRSVAIVLALSLLAGCHHAKAKPVAPPPFDGNAFLIATMQMASSNIAMAHIAETKGQIAQRETQRLARDVERDQRALLAGATAMAQRRGIAPPPGAPEAQVALQENLDAIKDEFDQAYALAMTQNLDALHASFTRAATSRDTQVRQFVAHYDPVIVARRTDAAQVLQQFGGSPFHVAP